MQPIKTYIVEDSELIRDNLVATLKDFVAIEVVGVAEDEATATRWLKEPGNEVDLVIVDIFLKVGSGLGVLRASQQHVSARKHVVLSNFANASIRSKCLELGANRVYDKSNEIDGLIAYCEAMARDEPALDTITSAL